VTITDIRAPARPEPHTRDFGSCILPPPWGGPEPSWIDGRYSDMVWVSRDVNDAVGRPYRLDFERIPLRFRDLTKWYLWAREYAPDNTRRGARSPRAPGTYYHIFVHLSGFLSFLVGYERRALSQVEPTDIEKWAEHWSSRPRDPRRRPPARSELPRLISMLTTLYRFGPSVLGYLPDGLSFDPRVTNAALLRDAQLRDDSHPTELSETIARQLLNLAFRWSEEVGPNFVLFQEVLNRMDLELGSPPRAGGHSRRYYERRVAFLSTRPHLRVLRSLLSSLPCPPEAVLGAGCSVHPLSRQCRRQKSGRLSGTVLACYAASSTTSPSFSARYSAGVFQPSA